MSRFPSLSSKKQVYISYGKTLCGGIVVSREVGHGDPCILGNTDHRSVSIARFFSYGKE